MYIIVGLGNPEPTFDSTRHNAGFMVVNELAKQLNAPAFELNSKCQSYVAKAGADFLFIKPTLYMNDSGQSVRATLDFFKLADDKSGTDVTAPEDLKLTSWQRQLYVIHDDLDLEIGKYKIQFGTGPALHNGLLSIYQHLGTKNFWHVRVGVDGRAGDRQVDPAAYVTQHFVGSEVLQFKTMLQQLTLELKNKLNIGS